MVDGVELEVEVADDVPLPVGDIEAVALALIVDDDVIVGVMVALNDTDGDTLAEAPKESVPLGVAVIVEERLIVVDPLSLPLGVCDAVGVDVLVPLPVFELVAVTDSLFVEVVESEPLSLPVNDGPAPFVTDAVGEREIDLDKLIVVVGVVLDVEVPVIVSLPVDVPLIETVLVVLPVFVLLGEFEGLDPNVIEVVGETVIDELIETVVVGVVLEVPVPDTVEDEVPLSDAP